MSFVLWSHPSHRQSFVEIKPSRGGGSSMQRKVGSAGSEITSCFFLNISVAGSGAFWTSFSRVSHNQTSSLLARPPLWVTPPLVRSDWPGGAQEAREIDWEKKRGAGLFSLYAYTLKRTGKRKECFHSTYCALSHQLRVQCHTNRTTPVFYHPGTVDLHRGPNHMPLTPGASVFSVWGECFDRSWPRRSAAIRSRSPCFIPSVRCLQWRPNMPPCCSRSAKWRVYQTAWMSWVMKSCPALGQPPSSFQHTPLLSWWVAKPFLGLTQTHARDAHMHAA